MAGAGQSTAISNDPVRLGALALAVVMGKYDSDITTPLDWCSVIALQFDGKTLTFYGLEKTYTYPAVSGAPVAAGAFDYSVDRQKQVNQGPIPAGDYMIFPYELTERGYIRHHWNEDSWGKYRVVIHPVRGTETYGRGGMFIHGGKTAGSIGCIDLTSYIDQFAADLKAEVCKTQNWKIPLRVSY
jgi:Protein of unknown function (DUF2778)